jgi:NADH-quinone oxidoreductase subunit J
MFDLLFYAFAFLTVGSALAMIFNRNAVNSAVFLLLSLVGVAAIFALLDTGLLAVLMIFVYAGAVVALFLFIVMLLDMKGGERPTFKRSTIIASTVAAALLALGLVSFARAADALPAPDAAEVVPVGADLKYYAAQLFTTYLLPVQVVGFLLLIAMLGVIVLSKRFEGLEDIK